MMSEASGLEVLPIRRDAPKAWETHQHDGEVGVAEARGSPLERLLAQLVGGGRPAVAVAGGPLRLEPPSALAQLRRRGVARATSAYGGGAPWRGGAQG